MTLLAVFSSSHSLLPEWQLRLLSSTHWYVLRRQPLPGDGNVPSFRLLPLPLAAKDGPRLAPHVQCLWGAVTGASLESRGEESVINSFSSSCFPGSCGCPDDSSREAPTNADNNDTCTHPYRELSTGSSIGETQKSLRKDQFNEFNVRKSECFCCSNGCPCQLPLCALSSLHS